jgi:hypothetical protein
MKRLVLAFALAGVVGGCGGARTADPTVEYVQYVVKAEQSIAAATTIDETDRLTRDLVTYIDTHPAPPCLAKLVSTLRRGADAWFARDMDAMHALDADYQTGLAEAKSSC